MNREPGISKLRIVDLRPDDDGPSGQVRPDVCSGADFRRLADVITALSAARGPAEIIEIVRRSARALSGAQGIAIIFNDDGFCNYLVEDSESPLWAGQKFPAHSCISGWAMMHDETVAIPDIFLDDRIPHDAYRPTFVRSLIMTPVGEGEPFAAIGAYWSQVRTPQPEEIAVMQALARSTATAFKNVQLHDSLKREAARSVALYHQAQERLSQKDKAEKYLRLMVNELNHRVKNSLATVQSIASQTLKGGPAVAEARDAFFVRLHGLSVIHEMLTEANWDSADLGDIAHRTLSAHAGDDAARIDIRGPPVPLSPQAASSLAMGLNELATNAIKHGALSAASGRVDLHWTIVESVAGAHLMLTWRESGGPAVSPPTQSGFGQRLLTRALPANLSGEVAIDYLAKGVDCVIRAPLSELSPKPSDPAFAL